MRKRTITVFGGSGFVGRHLARRLAADGWTIRIAVRDPEDAAYMKPMGDVGQIVPIPTNVLNEESVARAVEGVDCVVNLVGILSQWGRQKFENIHVTGAANIAKAATAADASRMVHISAVGVDAEALSLYGRTKAAGEAAVREAFPAAVILRPSVIFGPEDSFFNLFAGLARFTPALPVFGCPVIPKLTWFSDKGTVHCDIYGDGGTKLQPVYVGDVADAIVNALKTSAAAGETYELGGPQVYSSKEIMELLLKHIQRKRWLIPIPFFWLSFYAWFLEKWPETIITCDQINQLKTDNVAGSDAKGLADLGVEATGADTILPSYLTRFQLSRNRNIGEAFN